MRAKAQALAIGRVMFAGYLESEIMPAGLQVKALVWTVAFLAAPAFLIPVYLTGKYAILRLLGPAAVESGSWDDKLLFLALGTAASGLAAIAAWDSLFPDKRALSFVGALPVSRAAQTCGRVLGLFLLWSAFGLGLNLVPSLLFGATASPTNDVTDMLRTGVAHLIAGAAASAAVFFGIVALNGIVRVSAGRWAGRIAPLFQVACMAALIRTVLDAGYHARDVAAALERGDMASPFIRLSPLTWFIGLYDTVQGTSLPVMHALAGWAIPAAVLPLLVAPLALVRATGPRDELNRPYERTRRRTRVGSAVFALVGRCCRCNATELAVCEFTTRGIVRGRLHRIVVAAWIGAAVGVISATRLLDRGSADIARACAPGLLVAIASAIGLRASMAIPADVNAGWIFRSIPLTLPDVRRGQTIALLGLALPPIAIACVYPLVGVAPVSWWVLHGAVCIAIADAIITAASRSDARIGLTAPYVPGRSMVHFLWPVYLAGLIAFVRIASSAERWFMTRAGTWWILAAAAGIAGLCALSIAQCAGTEMAIDWESESPDDTQLHLFDAPRASRQAQAGVTVDDL